MQGFCRTNFGGGRHILQTLIACLNYHRSQRAPWCPSFSLAVRIFLLVRFSAAMYSNIQDCDEGMRDGRCLRLLLTHPSVFNFWEPLHYLDRGHGFQTWETSPEYAIRSYAYIVLHLISVKIPRFLFGDDKVGGSYPSRGLTVEDPLCRELLSSPSVEPFLSCRLSARQNSTGWFSRMSTGVWQDTCSS